VKIRQLLEAKCSGRTPVFGRRKSANLISLLRAFTDGMKSGAGKLLPTLVWLGSYTYCRFIGSHSLSYYDWKVSVLYVCSILLFA
jgi:hypothetical protein